MPYATAGKILDELQKRRSAEAPDDRLGYEVLMAANGESALQSVVRDPPDVILLDVNMPGIDGFEVCRRLKADAATRLISIVLITTLTASEDRIRGIDAGTDDFVSKPPVVAVLEARLRSLMRLTRYTDELDSAESVILSLGLTIEAVGRISLLMIALPDLGKVQLLIDRGANVRQWCGGRHACGTG